VDAVAAVASTSMGAVRSGPSSGAGCATSASAKSIDDITGFRISGWQGRAPLARRDPDAV
jgi:hypothetical protein